MISHRLVFWFIMALRIKYVSHFELSIALSSPIISFLFVYIDDIRVYDMSLCGYASSCKTQNYVVHTK